MKTRQRENILKRPARNSFRSDARKHDRMLVLNLALFNFTDGSSRTLSKYECAGSYA
jgi:hypothetical protein